MKVEVVIPAYNEQAIIKETALAIAGVLDGEHSIDWKITVADNGSTDSTKEVIENMNNPRIAVYTASGKGKGLALREAFNKSEASIVGFFDADLSVDPSILPVTLTLLDTGKADVVIGSRFHPDSRVDRGAYRSSSSRAFNLLSRIIIGVVHTDTQCGYKFMNTKGKEIFTQNTENTWLFDLEFLARCGKEGLLIQEVPVTWTEFRYPERKSKLHLLKDGLDAVVAMFRIRFAR
jgi:glycosyltransferase involved in cell wall biosynthesis